MDSQAPYPKIELHVHLEGTIRPECLLEIGRRNDYPLPADTVEGLGALYEFRDFDHFIEVWILVTNALRRADDFRQVVLDYAAEARGHGAVYLEGIFSPIERTWRGVDWDEIFGGYCDGAEEARELYGVEVRLTPDITRSAPIEDALKMVQYAVKYRDRGIVGVGLGGEEALFPPEPFEPAFREARDGGLGSVPHAGEVVGPESVWGALRALGPVRIRHGIRAVEDPALMRELRARGIVLDVCPISNLRTRAVLSPDRHPLPRLIENGIPCSISTDNPAMFDTDLTRDHELATSFGSSPRSLYESALAGVLCDAETKTRLEAIGDSYGWPGRS
ncbi:MAG: adenosine deaminase [Actinobacteria bacterium]|nr:MAG: adenosine deaminase [Actinomycetota bacterium]